jgi:hypothetical protein
LNGKISSAVVAVLSSYSLQSIEIPRNVQFIDGSAFADKKLKSILIESGNDLFRVEDEFLIDIVHHTLIHSFSNSSDIDIPRMIEMLGSSCFESCKSLSSISFGSIPVLRRIEAQALNGMSVRSVVIPSSVCLIASNAFHPECQISLFDSSSCLEFERWSAVRGW